MYNQYTIIYTINTCNNTYCTCSIVLIVLLIK